ncbi:MAG: sulfite exporter TauE/SafE family protein [Verrucomicrobiales bacterium]|nr:sulfite exporter TauE/SafE family protein [Verrucomicrobiales bacterium]
MNLPYDVTWIAIALACLGALSLGISKAGIPGLAIVNVLIIAEIFGAKNSVGIILPLLVVCDLIVLPIFWKHATWKMIWPLVPVTFVSIVGAWFLLDAFDDLTARRVIGAIILLMFFLQLAREFKKEFLEHLPDSRWFRWISCVLIGVSTMLANAAGPVYSIYGLVHKMPKMHFLGIGARFFLLVNIFKVPFLGQIDLINQESLKLNLILLPALLIGIFLGRKVLDYIPQRTFEILLYAFSAITGIRMLFF